MGGLEKVVMRSLGKEAKIFGRLGLLSWDPYRKRKQNPYSNEEDAVERRGRRNPCGMGGGAAASPLLEKLIFQKSPNEDRKRGTRGILRSTRPKEGKMQRTREYRQERKIGGRKL